MADTNTDPAALATENVTLRNALEAVRADFAKLQGETTIVAKGATESQAALTAAIRERDLFKTQVTELEPKAKLAADLEVKVTGYVNASREAAIVEVLRGSKEYTPEADLLSLRGTLTMLHDSGAINKFAEDAAAEAKKAFELIKVQAPGLTRPAMSASGTSLVRPNNAGPVQKTSLFR